MHVKSNVNAYYCIFHIILYLKHKNPHEALKALKIDKVKEIKTGKGRSARWMMMSAKPIF